MKKTVNHLKNEVRCSRKILLVKKNWEKKDGKNKKTNIELYTMLKESYQYQVESVLEDRQLVRSTHIVSEPSKYNDKIERDPLEFFGWHIYVCFLIQLALFVSLVMCF